MAEAFDPAEDFDPDELIRWHFDAMPGTKEPGFPNPYLDAFVGRMGWLSPLEVAEVEAGLRSPYGRVDPLSRKFNDYAARREAAWANFPPERFQTLWQSRELLTARYAWAIPNRAAVQRIAKESPIIEIGAGTGYWANLLATAGADVVAYDERPPRPDRTTNHWHQKASCWFPVRRGGPQKLIAHPERALFLCWPPYGRSFARDCLKFYRGKTLLYIGEGHGGCTGDDAFHKLLSSAWVEIDAVYIPQWHGLHDYLRVYRRKAC